MWATPSQISESGKLAMCFGYQLDVKNTDCQIHCCERSELLAFFGIMFLSENKFTGGLKIYYICLKKVDL